MATQVKESFGHKISFQVNGFGNLTGRQLRVIFEREDGTGFERTTAAGDVIVVDAATNTIAVNIKDGDYTIEGTYKYQVWDETAGIRAKSSVASFTVDHTLVRPS